ncbi:MAG: AN1-type zinc finger domain-containing protein, partial [Promethearchaeota archaeon]
MKCEYCGKEIGISFTCIRCGRTFCSEHRLPELHNCKFRDLRKEDVSLRLTLRKANMKQSALVRPQSSYYKKSTAASDSGFEFSDVNSDDFARSGPESDLNDDTDYFYEIDEEDEPDDFDDTIQFDRRRFGTPSFRVGPRSNSFRAGRYPPPDFLPGQRLFVKPFLLFRPMIFCLFLDIFSVIFSGFVQLFVIVIHIFFLPMLIYLGLKIQKKQIPSTFFKTFLQIFIVYIIIYFPIKIFISIFTRNIISLVIFMFI